jgi:SAM-dependent methyltransferase
MFDVIEHLPRHRELEALREAHRVLKPGGYLYLSTPHASWLHTPVDPAWLFGHRHYRKSTITNLLSSSGFKVERLFVAGGLIEGLDHIRLLIYKHMFQLPSPPIGLISRLIDGSHGRDQRLGMTVFAVASKPSWANQS